MVDSDEDFDVRKIKNLIIIEKRLKFEESEFLDALWAIGIETLVDNLNSEVKILFDGVCILTLGS